MVMVYEGTGAKVDPNSIKQLDIPQIDVPPLDLGPPPGLDSGPPPGLAPPAKP